MKERQSLCVLWWLHLHLNGQNDRSIHSPLYGSLTIISLDYPIQF